VCTAEPRRAEGRAPGGGSLRGAKFRGDPLKQKGGIASYALLMNQDRAHPDIYQLRCRVLRDIEVDDASSIVGQNHKDEQLSVLNILNS
jgi:hypothetical protein